ncbi:MAG: hypothetical protein KKG59_01075 [Nanoarchaeota archaeon]|nr:hypothetical protein [Nanoarchaeota archaeon]
MYQQFSVARLMSQDHERILGLFKEFKREKKKEGSNARHIFKSFMTELQTHFRAEERVCHLLRKHDKYSNLMVLASMLDKEHTMLIRQAQDIHAQLGKNQKFIDTSDLYELLTRHADTEDRYLYPEFDAQMTRSEKNWLRQQLKQERR